MLVVVAVGVFRETAPIPRATPTPTPTAILSALPTPTTPLETATIAPLEPQPLQAIGIERAFPHLEFSDLTNLVQLDDGLNDFVATDKSGRIWIFPNDDGARRAESFLDLRDRVSWQADPPFHEEGLLGLALDPGYRDNGYFYVYYSAAEPRRSVVSRFAVSEEARTVADPNSEYIIMEVAQPTPNHNGGQLAFGPDGYLYIGIGDGGLENQWQDPSNLLASILRIDVNDACLGENYCIPPGNPFVGIENVRGEIWAYGFRNPWRFSFDDNGLLWVVDVGQFNWEEINVVKRGGNYGWPLMEGSHCFPSGSACSVEGLELPIWELRNPFDTCALIGGHVYRGRAIAPILGAYVFGDYCTGRIWSLRYDELTERVDEFALLVPSLRDPYAINISGFGQDLAGNLYAFSVHEPTGIYKLVPDPVPADLLPPSRPAAATQGIPTQKPLSPSASRGRQLFLAPPPNAGTQTLWCQQCHSIEGIPGANGRVGPELTHLGILAAGRKSGMSAPEYLRESLVNPEAYVPPGVERAIPGLMTPSITEGLTTEQIDALVAFLLTLKP